MDSEYKKALELAKENLADYEKRGSGAEGEDVIAYIDSLLTEEELQEGESRVEMLTSFIQGMRERGLTIEALSEKSGIEKWKIEGFMTGEYDICLEELKKLAAGIGKKLTIAFN